MSGQYNVSETKKVVSLVAKAVQVVTLVKQDGKVDFNDIGHLMVLYPALQALPNFGVIPKEISDLDTVDAADLIAHVGLELGGLAEPKTKLIVEKSLLLIAAIVQLVDALSTKPAVAGA